MFDEEEPHLLESVAFQIGTAIQRMKLSEYKQKMLFNGAQPPRSGASRFRQSNAVFRQFNSQSGKDTNKR